MLENYGNFTLGINTGFAVNRYSEPEVWTEIIGNNLGLKKVQFTADMLNPSLPDNIIVDQVKRIKEGCEKYNIKITSTFTGAFTRVNHLAHPDPKLRAFWINWFKTFVDLSLALGAKSMGSHFGIFTERDNLNKSLRSERKRTEYKRLARNRRICKKTRSFLFELGPMSISTEQGETIQETKKLHKDVNQQSPIPFKICLDVDHGDVTSKNPEDTNPYAWLKEFAKEAPIIHLKQSSKNKGGHWPFIREHNLEGNIRPRKVLDTLKSNGVNDSELILELSFREREPTDGNVLSNLRESVNYWRKLIKN